MRHLAEAWLRTTGAVGARGDVAGAGAALLGRWVEPHRRYHDLAHLDVVLRTVDELAPWARDVEVVRLAAWFHDAVYDPTAPDNEARSALLAEKVLAGLRVPDGRVSEVVRLVAMTASHDPPDDDPDGAVLCDADLVVLAGNATAYGRYVEAVREEYGHLDDRAFRTGRAAVLRALLDRPALFRTDHGRTTWETPARANLTAELRHLEGGA
ncbi:MAG: HD domain-containing protein [Actinomycetes bacterium]